MVASAPEREIGDPPDHPEDRAADAGRDGVGHDKERPELLGAGRLGRCSGPSDRA